MTKEEDENQIFEVTYYTKGKKRQHKHRLFAKKKHITINEEKGESRFLVIDRNNPELAEEIIIPNTLISTIELKGKKKKVLTY